MSAQVAADLRAAADVLERDGWTQGTYHEPIEDGRWCHCAEGAVEVAAGSWRSGEWVFRREPMDREESALEVLRAHLLSIGIDPESIPDWNDESDRTAAEVIAALRAAADSAEAAS